MYSFETRISYSQVNSNLELTYFALVNLIQDSGCFHSEDIGFGMKYLSDNNLGWFVTSYEIHVNEMPKFGQNVVVSTYPYAFRGMIAKRKYVISSIEGKILAYADSTWILMNIKELKPVRTPSDMAEAYNDGVNPPELLFTGERLRVEADGNLAGAFVVSDNNIDTNGHMNNSFYIDLTRKYLPSEDFRTVKINYKKAALLGDKLDVFLVKLDEGFQVILKKEDEVYTIVEYK